jgi:hypothetical protein
VLRYGNDYMGLLELRIGYGMEGPVARKRSKLWVWAVIMIVAALVTLIAVYRLRGESPEKYQLSDPVNDVVLSLGTQYPGMIDVVGASLGANDTVLSVNITVRDPVSSLGDGEWAEWNVTVILENETDTLRVYEISVQLNSTVLAGVVDEIGGQSVRACEVSYYGGRLMLQAPADDLQNTKTVEWSILTTYEKYVGNELVTSASDIAPDEGLQQTVLRP